jgi:hypothetical protein
MRRFPRRFVIGIAVAALATPAIAYTALASAASSQPSDPASGGWQLNGSSQFLGTWLRLTGTTPNTAGSAFWPQPLPSAGLAISFNAAIAHGTGADGMALVFADSSSATPTALGGVGGSEGFAGIPGVAVSLDTYKNVTDPSANFVGIATGPLGGGLKYVATNTHIPALRNVVRRIGIVSTLNHLWIAIDGTTVLNTDVALPPSVLVGFTAANGSNTDVHQISHFKVTQFATATAVTTAGTPTPTPPSPPSSTPNPTTSTAAPAAPTTSTAAPAAPTTSTTSPPSPPSTVAVAAVGPSTVNSVALIVSDMNNPHEGALHGVPTSWSWAQHPAVGDPTNAQGMAAMTGWGQIYADANTAEPAGVRVEIKNMESYVWSLSQHRWVRVQATVTVDGAHYAENFAGNASIPTDLRTEPDGGVSLSMVPGYNFHFWPVSGRASITPGDIGAEFTTYHARLIGTATASARYLANVGGDWWRTTTIGFGTGTDNPGIGQGRFVYLTPNWTAVNFYTGGTYASAAGAWTGAQLTGSPPPIDAMGT